MHVWSVVECLQTVVVRQVEQNSYDGPHAVLDRLGHGSATRLQHPAVTLDHLFTPAQRPGGQKADNRIQSATPLTGGAGGASKCHRRQRTAHIQRQ